MKVIGGDPGLRHTGWGVVEFKNNKIFHIADGSISPLTKLDDGKRLLEIKNQLQKMINQFKPNISIKISRDTLLFTPHEIYTAMPIAILPKECEQKS